MELAERIVEKLGAKKKDYIKTEHPAGIGYRAIHAIAKFNQSLADGSVAARFEIQIRTWHQHLWACWCESLGEQAKEGFSKGKRSDQAFVEGKQDLIDHSNMIANWEENHQQAKQAKLPKFVDPYRVAVAWIDTRGNYGFRYCGTDSTFALKYIGYKESRRNTRPLLLLGVAGDSELHDLLRRTHPNFVGGRLLYPEDWVPVDA